MRFFVLNGIGQKNPDVMILVSNLPRYFTFRAFHVYLVYTQICFCVFCKYAQ